jgi:hypothetical protein
MYVRMCTYVCAMCVTYGHVRMYVCVRVINVCIYVCMYFLMEDGYACVLYTSICMYDGIRTVCGLVYKYLGVIRLFGFCTYVHMYVCSYVCLYGMYVLLRNNSGYAGMYLCCTIV